MKHKKETKSSIFVKLYTYKDNSIAHLQKLSTFFSTGHRVRFFQDESLNHLVCRRPQFFNLHFYTITRL